MAAQWWVQVNGNISGPLSSAQVREMVAAGKIRPRHLLSHDRQKWVHASSVKGLSFPNESVAAREGLVGEELAPPSETSDSLEGTVPSASTPEETRRPAAKATPPFSCPHCAAKLSENAVICIECGWNLRTGRSIASPARTTSGKTSHHKLWLRYTSLSLPIRITAAAGAVLVLVALGWLVVPRAEERAGEEAPLEAAPSNRSEAAIKPEPKQEPRPVENASRDIPNESHRLATASDINAAMESEVPLVDEPSKLVGNTQNVRSVDVSPDGRFTTAGANDGIAMAESEIPLVDEPIALRGHTQAVRSAAFSPDGRLIITGANDGVAILWDTVSREPQRRLKPGGFVASVAFSPDGRQIVTAVDTVAILWDTSTGKRLGSLQGHSRTVRSAVFSPDGQSVLTASEDGTAKLWSAADNQLDATLQGHRDCVFSAVFSPDGRLALTGSRDRTAMLWDDVTAQSVRRFQGHADFVIAVAFGPGGQTVLTGSYDGRAILWNIATGHKERTFTHGSTIYCVAFSADGRYLLTGSSDASVILWDARTGAKLNTFQEHTAAVTAAVFSPDARLVLTGSHDGTSILRNSGVRCNEAEPARMAPEMAAVAEAKGAPGEAGCEAVDPEEVWFRDEIETLGGLEALIQQDTEAADRNGDVETLVESSGMFPGKAGPNAASRVPTEAAAAEEVVRRLPSAVELSSGAVFRPDDFNIDLDAAESLVDAWVADNSSVLQVKHSSLFETAYVGHTGYRLNGLAIVFHDEETPMLYVKYDDNKMHGLLRLWDPEGRDVYWCEYRHGQRNGFCCWFGEEDLSMVSEVKAGEYGTIVLLSRGVELKRFRDEAEASKDKTGHHALYSVNRIEGDVKNIQVSLVRKVNDERRQREKEEKQGAIAKRSRRARANISARTNSRRAAANNSMQALRRMTSVSP